MDNTERYIQIGRLLIVTALTNAFLHSQGLEKEEAVIVARATTFMLEEILRDADRTATATALRELVTTEVDLLIAKQKEQRDRKSEG